MKCFYLWPLLRWTPPPQMWGPLKIFKIQRKLLLPRKMTFYVTVYTILEDILGFLVREEALNGISMEICFFPRLGKIVDYLMPPLGIRQSVGFNSTLCIAGLTIIDLKRITRYDLGIVRVVHFWKCYGSEASKS